MSYCHTGNRSEENNNLIIFKYPSSLESFLRFDFGPQKHPNLEASKSLQPDLKCFDWISRTRVEKHSAIGHNLPM